LANASLDDIAIFVAVADAGSFAAGGQSLGLSRSAAGKAIARLESRLGTRLLHRTTRALSLTIEGETFCAHCRAILAAVDAAEASVAGPDGGVPRGVLRVTMPDAFGRLVVLPLLERYLAAWPDIQVELSFTDRVDDLLEEGFDLAIRIGVTHGDSSLISRVIARYPVMLCAAPAYLAHRGEPRDIADLDGHDCLLFSSRQHRQGWHLPAADGSTVRVMGRSRLRLDSGDAIRRAAIAGLGIAYLPHFLIADDLASGRVQPLLAERVAAQVDIVVLYPDKYLLEARVRRFIDLLVEGIAAAGP
jgi:DNA-binding transcriptional LysR family regulator